MQTPPPAQAGDTRAGIFWMIMTMLMFVSMDTCAKYLVSHYPDDAGRVGPIFLFRS